MKTNERTIAVVDPVTLGGPYGQEIRHMGYQPVCLLTQEFTAPYVAMTFQGQYYEELHRQRTTDDAVAFLKRRRVEGIIPGAQTALAHVDALADALGLIGNPVESMLARTNKRVMKEYWREHGVACAAFFESNDVKAILAWVERQGYPIVLKPNASSGSSNVYVCTNEREVTKAFEVITHAPDMYQIDFPRCWPKNTWMATNIS